MKKTILSILTILTLFIVFTETGIAKDYGAFLDAKRTQTHHLSQAISAESYSI